MGKRAIRQLKAVEIKYGRDTLERLLDFTTEDIKINRMSYGLRTNIEEFMNIFNIYFFLFLQKMGNAS